MHHATARDEIAFAGAIQSEQTLVTFARLPFTGREQILAFRHRVNLPTGIIRTEKNLRLSVGPLDQSAGVRRDHPRRPFS